MLDLIIRIRDYTSEQFLVIADRDCQCPKELCSGNYVGDWCELPLQRSPCMQYDARYYINSLLFTFLIVDHLCTPSLSGCDTAPSAGMMRGLPLTMIGSSACFTMIRSVSF